MGDPRIAASAMLSILVAGLALTGSSFRVTPSTQRVTMMAKKEEQPKGFFLGDFLSAPARLINPSFKAERPQMSLLAPDDSRDIFEAQPVGPCARLRHAHAKVWQKEGHARAVSQERYAGKQVWQEVKTLKETICSCQL